MKRATEVGRGLAAVIALAALLVGPPAALAIAVGWPLPTTLPALESITTAARSGVSDGIVVKTLAVILWLAWLQVALSILGELTAVARRRPARHLPVLPGIQPAIARLVAAALLIAATTTARTPAASALPLQSVNAPVPTLTEPPPAPAPMATTTAPQNLPTTQTVVVERHDSYWEIAERILGDGFRWREIRDANLGRTMPDGHVITTSSELLVAGWELQIPATATTATADPIVAPALEPTGVEITVERGDGFWQIATAQVQAQIGRTPTDEEIQPYWTAFIAANADRLADPGDPNLLFTGQQLALVGPPAPQPPAPVVPAEPDAPPATPPAPEAPPASMPEETPPPSVATSIPDPIPADDGAVAHDGDGDGPRAALVGSAFSTLLAVGALRALARRRRRRAHQHSVPDAPTPDPVTDTHRDLIVAADDHQVDDLHGQLARLATDLRDHQLDTTPLIVQHGVGHLDVYLDPPLAPPSGWEAVSADGVWSPQGGALAAATADASPAPLLVTLGQPDDGGQVYLDLEAADVTALTGDPAVARDVAQTMVAELALSPFADGLDLIVIGDGLTTPDAASLDHVRTATGWNDVAGELLAWITQTRDALAINGWPNPFVARAIDPGHDALAPLAIVAGEPPPEEMLEHLVHAQPAVAGIVVIGSVAGALEVDCNADRLLVPRLGLEVTPHPLTDQSITDIVALLEDPVDEPLVIDEPTLFTDIDESRAEVDPGEVDVMVRVLGDIHVDGHPDLTAKQTAVLAYIALHGNVAADRVEDAVWAAPTGGSRRKRLANTMSEVRAAIGRHHLPAAADGRYTTGPGVSTDAHAFDHLVRRAASEPPDAAAATLRAALDLVTGPVFTYRTAERGNYTWVDLENLVSTWELRVAAVAERCTDLHLELGRAADAADIANRALGIIPTHTGITEALMRAHAATGDRLAVQRVYQAHASALEHLDLDDVADSTTELYQQLARSVG